MSELRDPRIDPRPGDCIYRLGAQFNRRYRLVVAREEMNITFMTSAGSTRRLIWLTSWQEWSTGSDVQMVAEQHDTSLDVESIFNKLDQEDLARKKTGFSTSR